jgi:50S ribosomal protein L3, bacterial
MAAIIGKKVGMTQIFQEDGTRVPVTVIEAGPCPVTAVRDPERDGYKAVQLAFDPVDERKLTKAELGHLKKAGVGPMRTLVEFRDEDLGSEEGPKVGDVATVEQFEPGQKVKVSGVAIGKGFQGTVRRHGFGRGPVTHGSHNVRAPGSIGAAAFPARVFKGLRMPGHMGGKRVTQRGLEVVEVDAERNLLILRGAVPGPKNGTVEVRSDG